PAAAQCFGHDALRAVHEETVRQPQHVPMLHVEQQTTGMLGNLYSQARQCPASLDTLTRRCDVASTEAAEPLDGLDAALLLLLSDEPRLGVLECSRRLGVARGTVQARLDRLERRGVLRGPHVRLRLADLGVGQ